MREPGSVSAPKVLILNWRDLGNPLAGGGEVHVWRVFQEALRRGWDVRAVCCGFAGAVREEVVDGIRVTRCGTELTYPAHLPFTYRRLHKEFRPDLVFEVMDKLPLMTPLYVREPSTCFLHHFFGDAAPLEVSWPVAWTVQTAERLVPYVYSKVPFMTGSPSATRELVELGIPQENVDTLSYGVDMNLLGLTTKMAHPSLVYVGRLRRYKHVDHLLQATAGLLKTLPELCVDIVGTGDAEPDLRRLAESLGITSHVKFHGHATETERRDLMGRAWVACMPSMKEGFGLTIPEAALCGTPTVGYDVPGVCDAIEHGVTGLLAPYGNVQALEDALSSLLHDKTARNRLAAQAAHKYEDFTWENAAVTTLAALESRRNVTIGTSMTPVAGRTMENACPTDSGHELASAARATV